MVLKLTMFNSPKWEIDKITVGGGGELERKRKEEGEFGVSKITGLQLTRMWVKCRIWIKMDEVFNLSGS